MIQIINAAAAQGSQMPMILMWVVLGVIFWIFFIRPQHKRQKEIQKFRDSITVGTKVVTAGGIYGEVRAIDLDNTISVEIAKGVIIRVDRNCVNAAAPTDQAK